MLLNTGQKQPFTLDDVRANRVTLDQLKQGIPAHKDVGVNRRMITGDYWDNGNDWVGPGPKRGDPMHEPIMALVKSGFASRNVLDELCDRLISAILGKEPRWEWVPKRNRTADEQPTDAESALMQEVNAATTYWWDWRKGHKQLKAMLKKMFYGQRATERLYVPTGMAPGGEVTNDDFAAALMMIHLDIPEPDESGVWEDPDTKQLVGIVFFRNAAGEELAEITYLDNAGKTVIRTIGKKQGTGETPAPNDLGGILPIYQITSDRPFLTEQLRSLNRNLNMALTLLGKGLVDNAFLERLITNALPPGDWEYERDASGNIVKDAMGDPIRVGYKVAPHRTGGRQTSYVRGIDFKDADGKVQLATPGVHFRDPVDPTGTIKGCEYFYGCMLDEGRQAHVMINKDAGLSGKSREKAQGDFMDSTNDPQLEIELAGRALFTALVAMGELIAGTPGKYTKTLKPVFKCRPFYGPLNTNDRKQNIDEAKDGFMAYQTAMALNGTDDTTAEVALIHDQEASILGLTKARAEVANLLYTMGFGQFASLVAVGMTEEDAQALVDLNAKSVGKEQNNVVNAPPAPTDTPLTTAKKPTPTRPAAKDARVRP